MTPPVDGAVLTGGRSSRMGRDKAVLRPDGPDGPMLAELVARALRRAGAQRVLAVGGDADALQHAGLVPTGEPEPGAGPLSGVIGALEAAAGDIVVIVACDVPRLDAATVDLLVQRLLDGPAEVAVATTDGRRQPLLAAWRRDVTSRVVAMFASGERSVRRVLDDLRVVEVELADPLVAEDLDVPGDLDRYARLRTRPTDGVGPEPEE